MCIWKGVSALYKVADTPFHIQGEINILQEALFNYFCFSVWWFLCQRLWPHLIPGDDCGLYVLAKDSTIKVIWAKVTKDIQSKWNESGFRPPLCTYRLNWARRTFWGWWDKWDDTVSRHRIRNSGPGGLRPSTLPLGHGGSPQYWLLHVDGEETHLCFF